ncbi:MAG: Uma2 family endonuclease [Chloroflexota bacterium]|nr:Uma2 family endonuclease [Chloroflexota bacterium]
MTTQTAKVKYTYEDYMQTPDDIRYELLDGELILSPSARTAHQRSVGKIFKRLSDFVMQNELGEVFIAPYDVVLDNFNVVQPDILFVSNERTHIITELNIRGAPDLVIEVLSPSTAQRDRTQKRDLYAQHDVKEYWQSDTDAKSVQVLTLENGVYRVAGIYTAGQTILSPLLQGFSLNVDEIF